MLRLCILNHSTSQRDVDRALELAATLHLDVGRAPAVAREGYPALGRGWLRRPALDRRALRAVALFSTLDDEQADRVLLEAREHHAGAGEAVIELWGVSHDLFVILDGAVEVTADGRRLNVLRSGDFFGELAAIEWGAGFARTRSTTVIAVEPSRLLVLDWVL